MNANVRTLLADAGRRLADAGVETPRLDARLLLAAAMETTADRLVGAPEASVSAAAARRFAAAVDRRVAREPVSRILGVREFWSLDFRIGRATLDPRPDSETLVAAALARLPQRAAPLRLLDLGCGSGCLLLALMSELPHATGLGIDLAPGAVALAAANARRLGLAGRARFRIGDWDHALAGRFDLIVSNPPYIERPVLATLAPEVRLHDPPLALDGGRDGLAAHRAVGRALARRLGRDGFAVVEVGAGQADAAAAVYLTAGLELVGRERDLAGGFRGLILRRKAAKKLLETAGRGSSLAPDKRDPEVWPRGARPALCPLQTNIA
jgi:release factor glutamine methyltransferase